MLVLSHVEGYVEKLINVPFIFLKGVILIALILLGVACTSSNKDVSTQPNPVVTTESSSSSGSLSPSPTVVSGPNGSAGTASLPDVGPMEPSAQRAYDHVKALSADIGSRPTGADGERKAAEYISAQFKSYGYSVSLQDFSFPFFRDNGSTLEVTSPIQESFTPKTMAFSKGDEVEGVVAFAGLGRSEDLALVDLKGKIALLERGLITFQQKVEGAAARGAIGAIVYNNQAGELQGSLQNLSGIPVVSLPMNEGQRIRELLAQGDVRAKVKVDTGPAEIHSQNVIAVPSLSKDPAGGTKPCTVVVGGHYDSVEAGPGANDNASGTAVVMELSRAARDLAFNTGVCFVAFGGEELGLWGSRRYVESLSSQDKTRLKGMINLDMVGVGDRWRISGSEDLIALAVQAAKAEGIEAQSFTMPRMFGSDHASFINAGIPAVFVHRLDDPNYHTSEDKIEFIAADALGDSAKIALGVIKNLTG